jgi:diadenosine tetraphosphate (Ap4A) HIT family hydrolase
VHHYRKTIKVYRARKDPHNCPFCLPETLAKAVYEDKHVYVLHNLTKYDLWELFDVQEHLLVVPKRHVEALTQLDAEERTSLINVIADYESRGYSIYARGVGFVNRSVNHQHTHLIKTSNRRPKLAVFFTKPYLLIKR